MLVLSRKKNQSIQIGPDIRIVVLDVQKDMVKIGVEAPVDVGIYRTEIYLALQEANRDAVASAGLLELLQVKKNSSSTSTERASKK